MPIYVAAAPNVDAETRRRYEEAYGRALGDVGDDVAVFVVLTGGAEPEILEKALPYNVLVAWPHYNSLPSALEASAALRERGRFAYVVALEDLPEEPPVERIMKAVRAAHLLKNPPRLALVGRPNPWLAASHLAGKPDVVIDEEEVYRESLALEAREEAERLAGGLHGAEALERPAAYAKALLRRAAGVDGLTLGCWCFDFAAVEKRGWTPCVSLALLNDWGLTAVCEGDMRALYSAVVLSKISGRPAWAANVNYAGRGLLILTHDGLPPSMARRYRIRPRLATGAPAAIEAEVEPGRPITLLRVSGDLRRALLLRGTTAQAPRIEACAAQIAVETPQAEAVLAAGLGNHLAFVLDDVYHETKAYLQHLGVQVAP